jgi:hypothetical protein
MTTRASIYFHNQRFMHTEFPYNPRSD